MKGPFVLRSPLHVNAREKVRIGAPLIRARLIRQGTRALLHALRHAGRNNARTRNVELVRLGTEYGGWIIPDGVLGPESICVSIGCGEDISFDVELADRYGCRVAMFDPTPRAVVHATAVLASAEDGPVVAINGSAHDCYRMSGAVAARLSFHAEAVSGVTGQVTFFAPTRTDFVSCSIHPDGMSDDTIDVPSVTIDEAFARVAGPSRVPDLLKMDIEGAEHEVIRRMVELRMLPKIVCVELDGLSPRYASFSMKWQTLESLRRLHHFYDVIAVDSLNVTLLRRELPS